MPHPDDEALVGLAILDSMPRDLLEHVTGCPTCAENISEIRHLVSVGHSAPASPAWDAPPSRVWDAITADLDSPSQAEPDPPSQAEPDPPSRAEPDPPSRAGLDPPSRANASPSRAEPDPPSRAEPDPPSRAEPDPPARAGLDPPSPPDASPNAVVVPIRRADQRSPRGSRLLRWTVGAAAAGLLVGSVGIRLIDGADAPDSTQLASVALDTLDTRVKLGEAEVVRVGGAVDLRVDTQPLAADGGYLEVWLINGDLKRMVSVGVLGEGDRSASFPISADLLSKGYVIVDISRETFDDKPQHSGDSLVRGALPI